MSAPCHKIFMQLKIVLQLRAWVFHCWVFRGVAKFLKWNFGAILKCLMKIAIFERKSLIQGPFRTKNGVTPTGNSGRKIAENLPIKLYFWMRPPIISIAFDSPFRASALAEQWSEKDTLSKWLPNPTLLIKSYLSLHKYLFYSNQLNKWKFYEYNLLN